jgi:hypothetical protein
VNSCEASTREGSAWPYIYLTDERWRHICEEHPEMQSYRRHVLETIRKGLRLQDSVRPDVYPYDRDDQGLP